MNVGTRSNREPIIADQHYGLSDLSGFQSIQGGLSPFQTPTNNPIYIRVNTPLQSWQPLTLHPGDAGLCDPSPFTFIAATTGIAKKRVGRLRKTYNVTVMSPNEFGVQVLTTPNHQNESLFEKQECSFAFGDYHEYEDEKNEFDDVVDDNPLPNYQKWQKYMSFKPDIPETPLYKSKPMISKHYKKETGVKVGQIFDNKEALDLAIRLKALDEGYQFLNDRSAPERYALKCFHFNECAWKIRATRWGETEKFSIAFFNDVHTCPKTQTYPNHRNANKKVIAHILTLKLQDTKRVLKGKDIQQDIMSEYKINISYQQAWRGKDYCMQQIRGSPYESFEMLPYYCYNLERKNEGTVTRIKTAEKGVFEMLFIALGGSICTFVNYLRPLVIIDAAHLKGQYKGTNLIDAGMDGNNQIVPISFGICKGKTGLCWSWWMSVLKECIGDNLGLLCISDRHAAIALAVQNEFPLAYHAVFGPQRWSRVTSNSVESVNACTVVYRKLPVIKLAETYRAMVQDWYYKRRKLAGTCQCRKWQLSGLPCGHVIAVTKYLGLTDCLQFVSDWFKKPKYQGTYAEPIHFIRNVQEWEFPQHIRKAIPPRMDDPQPRKISRRFTTVYYTLPPNNTLSGLKQIKNDYDTNVMYDIAKVAGKIQLFVSHHQIDLSTVLIPNDGSLEEAFAENVRSNVLMKLQEALDEEAILKEQILTLMHRFADRFTDRRVEINNLMVLQDHPLIDYAKYAIGCMTGADMKKCVHLKSVRDKLLRSMEEKRQLMTNYRDM
ncbi:transposase, MuDR, MULE transposase domain protein [Tanacetum coccineum]